MIDTTIDYYYDGDEEGACNRQSVQKDEAKQLEFSTLRANLTTVLSCQNLEVINTLQGNMSNHHYNDGVMDSLCSPTRITLFSVSLNLTKLQKKGIVLKAVFNAFQSQYLKNEFCASFASTRIYVGTSLQ